MWRITYGHTGGPVKIFPTFLFALSALLVACPAPQDDQSAGPPGPPGPGPSGPALGEEGQPGMQQMGEPKQLSDEEMKARTQQMGEPQQPGAEGEPPVGDEARVDPPGNAGDEPEAELASPVKGHIEDFSTSQKGGPEGVGEGDLLVLPPMRKQEDIKGGAHFSLSGTVSGGCDGKLRIDVLSQTPVSGEAGKVGPLTAVEMSEPGSFEVLVPEGDKVELSAICDADGDDRVGAGDSLSAPMAAAGLSATKSGIALTLEPLSGVPNPEEGGKERD
jgi:hypothetical protein